MEKFHYLGAWHRGYKMFLCPDGHIASPLPVRTYMRTSVRTYVDVRTYVRKMVSGPYLLNALVYWIHISFTGI